MGTGISRIDSAAQHSVREPYNDDIGPLILDQTEVSSLVKALEGDRRVSLALFQFK